MFRPDIQGLRAVAVGVVILDHLLGWPSGGFVGVDVFFVISGFLITGILLKEHQSTGRISFVHFYRRRLKRIIPAATLTLLATVVAAYFLFNKTRFAETAWDALASFLFVSNWRFAADGTDYFTADGPVSPIQNFWSLSVEEQFYFVWPWLLLGVLLIAARFGLRRTRVISAVVMSLLVVASFAWALVQTTSVPTVAYFSTLTRAWELGLGALLAISSPLWARLHPSIRPVLAWAGLGAIVFCLVVYNDATPFPAPWALVPVLAAVAVIGAGTGSTGRSYAIALAPLGNRVMVFVGDISYSLYLWHFPIIIFTASILGASPETYIVSLVLIAVISVLSYFLVESPLHKSPWLDSYATRRLRQHAWREWRARWRQTHLVAGMTLLVLIVGGTTALALTPVAPRTATAAVDPLSTPAASDPALPAAGPETARVQQLLSEAVAATSWPQLSPSMDEVIARNSTGDATSACFDTGPMPDLDACTWGAADAADHMYLVGDSIARSYAPAFRSIAEASGGQLKVTTIGMFGCRFADISYVINDDAAEAECPARRAEIVAAIQAARPGQLVVANSFRAARTQDGDDITAVTMVDATFREVASVQTPEMRVIYLASPPEGRDLEECYTPQSVPTDCMTEVSRYWQASESTTRSRAETTPSSYYVSALPFSCFDNRCPAFAGTTATKFDPTHLTGDWAKAVAPAISELIAAAENPQDSPPPVTAH